MARSRGEHRCCGSCASQHQLRDGLDRTQLDWCNIVAPWLLVNPVGSLFDSSEADAIDLL
jgi:hypothetical protein